MVNQLCFAIRTGERGLVGVTFHRNAPRGKAQVLEPFQKADFLHVGITAQKAAPLNHLGDANGVDGQRQSGSLGIRHKAQEGAIHQHVFAAMQVEQRLFGQHVIGDGYGIGLLIVNGQQEGAPQRVQRSRHTAGLVGFQQNLPQTQAWMLIQQRLMVQHIAFQYHTAGIVFKINLILRKLGQVARAGQYQSLVRVFSQLHQSSSPCVDWRMPKTCRPMRSPIVAQSHGESKRAFGACGMGQGMVR